MKKLQLITGVLVLFAATPCIVQNGQGVITYETKVNMHRRLPDDRQQMKTMTPEYRTTLDQLLFDEEESLYKPVEEEPEDEFDNGGGMRVRFRRPNNEFYTRPAEGRLITLHDFMGKKYLVEDSINMNPWKLDTEVKEINGYSCRKATYFDAGKKMNVIAWYSDSFRPFLGPENFNTLPGGVLLVDINDGERIITAKTIELRPLKKNEMKVPAAKNRVTDAEYRAMVREQMDRIRANGGNMIIRH